jgi:hypothetical protein
MARPNGHILPPPCMEGHVRPRELIETQSASGSNSDSWYRAPVRIARGRGRGGGRGRGTGRDNRGGRTGRPRVGMPILEDLLAARFSPATWKKNGHHYANEPLDFTGPEPGCTHPYGRLPSLMGLLEKFWSNTVERRIVRETNRYASEVLDNTNGNTRRGLQWTPLGLQEFRAYIAMTLFMGVKKLPSTRLYWSRNEALFHCSVISQLMTRERYELITRCLHVANAPAHIMDHGSTTYDKLHKVRWLVDEVRDRFKAM